MTDNLKHKIIKYLNSEFSNLEQFETEVYRDYIFFMKDGKVIFDYNKINKVVHISNDEIWSFLESFFGLEYSEIQSLTKEWVEEHCKLEVKTTNFYFFSKWSWVEEYSKLEVTTTNNWLPKNIIPVVEHYKLETNE